MVMVMGTRRNGHITWCSGGGHTAWRYGDRHAMQDGDGHTTPDGDRHMTCEGDGHSTQRDGVGHVIWCEGNGSDYF